MKIFFIASIYGKEKYEANYVYLVKCIEKLDHVVEADHVLNTTKEDLFRWDDEKDLDFHKKILTGIKKADVVVCELSHQSTSVGYLISVAIESGIPTIVFYSGRDQPHLLSTLESDEKFQAIHYETFADLDRELPISLQYASEKQDTRFNFFISPKISTYLDWISKEKRVPRAVYLRRLIEEDMKKNKGEV